MGLDGYVGCDCVEKGTARVPAAIAGLVKIDRDSGANYLDSLDKRHRRIYSEWRASKPCPHDGFMLLVGRLGSEHGIAGIREFLRNGVADPESEFPVLWKKVVHGRVRSGDSLAVKEVQRLAEELKLRPATDDKVTNRFFARLDELVAAALTVGKPIWF